MNREGFWYSREEPDLPMPIANKSPWNGQKEFLEKLSFIENSVDWGPNKEGYFGYSGCRICDCDNGSAEYRISDWTWPEGFRHYVEVHNVKPSDEFIRFVMQEI